jgi:glycerophosphoryl diester phosphodiesterase
MRNKLGLTVRKLMAEKLIAHRGYQRHFPENSPLAIEKAIAYGAKFIEIDVQFSADGIPLLYHDDHLKRISGKSGNLKQYRFADLQTFSAGEPKRFGHQFSQVKISALAALVDILQRNPDVQMLIELKEEAVRDYGTETCLARIHASLLPVIQQCILISFDIDALRKARAAGFSRIGAVIRQWKDRHEIARELCAEMIICNHQRIPAKDSLSMENCAVAVYEIDDIALAQSLLARGSGFIETFAIGELLGTYDNH